MDSALSEAELRGKSAVMRQVRAMIARLADVPWPVRVEGPSGSGKGVAARLLHQLSTRAHGPFLSRPLNMLTEELALAELVGHARGAFTGALTDRVGAFEAAHGGTLFLDEIALASARVQEHLLQLVEDGEVRRLGEHRCRRVNVRLIVATNANLESRVLEGAFRQDLYWRLGQLVLRMPALAEHREDVGALCTHVLGRLALQTNTEPMELGAPEISALERYEWPGNVRELIGVMQHLVVYGDLPAHVWSPTAEAGSWRERLGEALERARGCKSKAARELGISRKTLYVELGKRAKAG